MNYIIDQDQQKKILIKLALKRKWRYQIADDIGLSLPTLRKILNSNTPVIVNAKVYKNVNNWIERG
ncbi:hypothetical protein YK48G_17350 [Lentilactobacillus fungorum]|uniref:XRE family transcriptional regulator n=1 Tax=Lentilactobacillus fungorum TaxID=2201250 RepID=A0ABQ3W0F1_9LACO|nr:hypothetical protein YK48G_17350 [Lentilactobacillus fungorum]